MEILLKQKWDTPLVAPYHNSPVAEKTNFIGREKEIELLTKDLLQKDQGSILVAGHRGVGKTSLVYKVLSNIRSKQNDSIFIYLNAGQFTGTDTPQITSESILKSLIRRLYATSKDIFSENKPIDNISSGEKILHIPDPEIRLEKLYKKAVAKEFKLQENVLKTNSAKNTIEKEKEKKITISDLKLSDVLTPISFIVGLGFFTFTPSDYGIWIRIFSFLMMIPLPLVFSYSYLKRQSDKKETSFEIKAEEIYGVDNNLCNLEYDLEEFHRWLYLKKIKIIYVIDELDKLDEGQVKTIIRYLKNLFTLSKAIFVFIANEDIYNKATTEVAGADYRPEYYTFFTSKYFISRPSLEEIMQFFFSLIDGWNKYDAVLLRRIGHYLAYESKSDYFNLVNIIKDHIVKYENENPVIEISVNNPVILKKSRLHECISLVFYQLYYSDNISRKYENELINRSLIDYMYHLKETKVLIKDPDGVTRKDSALRDVNRVLTDLGFLKAGGAMKITISGTDIIISDYNNTGTFIKTPPERLEMLSENEKRFIVLSDEYLQQMVMLCNTTREINGQQHMSLEYFKDRLNGSSLVEIPNPVPIPTGDWQNMYFDLQLRQPVDVYTPEKVETRIGDLEEVKSRLKYSGYEVLQYQITEWCIKNGYSKNEKNDFAPIASLQSLLLRDKETFSDYFNYVKSTLLNKWGLFFTKLNQNLIDAVNRINNKDAFYRNTLVFAIQTDETDTTELKKLLNPRIRTIDVSSPTKTLESIKKVLNEIKAFEPK